MTDKIVFFDNATLYGHSLGVVQVTLDADILVFDESIGDVARAVETVARLRCAPAAARHLISALEKAIAMAEQPAEEGKPKLACYPCPPSKRANSSRVLTDTAITPAPQIAKGTDWLAGPFSKNTIVRPIFNLDGVAGLFLYRNGKLWAWLYQSTRQPRHRALCDT